MSFFTTFSSNTTAGSGNQSFFQPKQPKDWQTGRLFYRVFQGGSFRYALLFSNVTDSTFADGSHSRANLLCGPWEIGSVSVAACKSPAEIGAFVPPTFAGNAGKTVCSDAWIYTDAVPLDVPDGGYVCVQITFRGERIPYHEETLLPTFLYENGAWKPSNRMPFPSMIGCDREVKARISFLGDSITQGIGTPPDSYAHWNALLAERLGNAYAYWNLGLGFGRAEDAASDGAWLAKAKQTDACFLCFGVNDLLQGRSAEQIEHDLTVTVDKLQESGVRVLLQTVPPFDYQGETVYKWEEVNDYIRSTLAKRCDAMFDVVPVLCGEQSQTAKFGGHPNTDGCRAWADALCPVALRFLQTQDRMA